MKYDPEYEYIKIAEKKLKVFLPLEKFWLIRADEIKLGRIVQQTNLIIFLQVHIDDYPFKNQIISYVVFRNIAQDRLFSSKDSFSRRS